MQKTCVLPNGLTVLLDEIPEVRSVGLALLVPGGLAHDPPEGVGASLILAELSGRGAGRFSEREFADTLDGSGISHDRSSGLSVTVHSASLLPANLETGMELLAAVVFAPHLPAAQLDAVRALFLHDLDGLEEDPARRLLLELSHVLLKDPFGRPSVGTHNGLLRCDHQLLTEIAANRRGVSGCVLSVAGAIDIDNAERLVLRHFGDFVGRAPEIPRFEGFHPPSRVQLKEDTEQVHIGLAFPSAAVSSPRHYAAKVAAEVLSGSMSGRLFLELREKRGLCYEVSLHHQGGIQYGYFSAYCATSETKASAALDLLISELERLPRDLGEKEIVHARTNLEASIILSEEGPLDRAKANAFDQLLLGRVRPLEELQRLIQSVTVDEVRGLWEEYPPGRHVCVALGASAPWGKGGN